MGFHNNVRSSLLKACSDFKTILASSSITVQVKDFDAFSTMTKLPEADCIGIKNFSWVEENSLLEIEVFFVVTTFNDENLFRHHKILDLWTPRLVVEQKIKVYDANASPLQELGWLVAIDGTSVLPMASNDETRNFQFISVSFVSDISVK